MKKLFVKGLLIVLFFMVQSCRTGSKTGYEQIVRSPVPDQDIRFQQFEFDADSAISIELATGTQVRFDPSSFETVSGNAVKGRISVKMREFHSAVDLFRAGIPMSVDENRDAFLQSAGMMEIRVFQGSEELRLRDGRNGVVELAGFRPSDGYSLYHLEDDIRWKVRDTFRSGLNERKRARLRLLDEDSLQRVSSFEIVADLSAVPQFKPFKGLLWEPVRGSDNRKIMEEAMRLIWSTVRVIPVDSKQSLFRLEFVKEISQEDGETLEESLTVLARPRLAGKSVDNLMRDAERINQQLEEENRRLLAEADMVNSFRINRLGIWNIDKLMKMDIVTVAVSFDFQRHLDPDVHRIMLYMICDEENSVVNVDMKDWNKVQVPRDKQVRFVSVLPGNKVVITDYDQIQGFIRSGSKQWQLRTRLAGQGEWAIGR